jgi:hypothetical protein
MRLLGLDAPSQAPGGEREDPEKEAAGRVVWSCYIVDVHLASGVDKNSSWRGDVPMNSLPCSDAEFLSLAACRPPTLLDTLDTPEIIQTMDLPALIAVVSHLRKSTWAARSTQTR